MGEFNLSFKVLINLFQQILMTVAAYKVKLAAYEAGGVNVYYPFHTFYRFTILSVLKVTNISKIQTCVSSQSRKSCSTYY